MGRFIQCSIAVLVATTAACGGSAEPKAASLVGPWKGTVAAAGSRPASTVSVSLTSNGADSYTGISIVAVGTDSLFYTVSGVAIGGSLSLSMTGIAPQYPFTTYDASVGTSSLTGTINGGQFHNDALNLTRAP